MCVRVIERYVLGCVCVTDRDDFVLFSFSFFLEIGYSRSLDDHFSLFFFQYVPTIYSTQTSRVAKTPEMTFLGKLECIEKTPAEKYCLVVEVELIKVLYLRS